MIGKVVNITADESVMVGDKADISLVNANAFDPYTHGYYRVSERVGEAFKDGLQLKSNYREPLRNERFSSVKTPIIPGSL